MDEILDKSEILALCYHVMLTGPTPEWVEAAKHVAKQIEGTDKIIIVRDSAK